MATSPQLSIDQAIEAQARSKSIMDRKKAMEMERSRAQRIAALPTPQPYDLVLVHNTLLCVVRYVVLYRIFIHIRVG